MRQSTLPEKREVIAEALWELALEIEEGDVSDARERMERAQERLSQAMKNGASDEEIAELMQELRGKPRLYAPAFPRGTAPARAGGSTSSRVKL